MRSLFLLLFFWVLLISSVSANIDCTITSISKTMEEGGEIPSVDSFSCTNNYNDTIVEINKIGSFFTLSETTPITIGAEDTVEITVSFENVLEGNYEGMIYSEGLGIPVHLEVTPASDPNACHLNPSLVSFSQTVQQGVIF